MAVRGGQPHVRHARRPYGRKRTAAAVKRYASHAEMVSRELSGSSAHLAKGATEQVKLLPYWDVVEKNDKKIEGGIRNVLAMAGEAAHWIQRATEGSSSTGRGDMSLQRLQAAGNARTIAAYALEAYATVGSEFEEELMKELRSRRAVTVPTPKNFDEAMRSEFGPLWRLAVEKELENIRSHGVYEWVPRPVNESLVDSNWAWKVKRNDEGLVSAAKAIKKVEHLI